MTWGSWCSVYNMLFCFVFILASECWLQVFIMKLLRFIFSCKSIDFILFYFLLLLLFYFILGVYFECFGCRSLCRNNLNYCMNFFLPLFSLIVPFFFPAGGFILASAFWLHVFIMKLIKSRSILPFILWLCFWPECFGCRSLAVNKI